MSPVSWPISGGNRVRPNSDKPDTVRPFPAFLHSSISRSTLLYAACSSLVISGVGMGGGDEVLVGYAGGGVENFQGQKGGQCPFGARDY